MEVRNRFKGLDLIDRVPEELWMEFRDIVQETGIKTIPMEKKCKKAKWLSEKALQIVVKRREVKSKGEKERYFHLNAEFQRIQRLGLFIPNVGAMGSIPGQGTKISNATWYGQIKKLIKKKVFFSFCVCFSCIICVKSIISL